MAKLPKRVFVYWETGSDGSRWLEAETSLEKCAEKGKKRIVGEYELVQTYETELVVSSEVVSKPVKNERG